MTYLIGSGGAAAFLKAAPKFGIPASGRHVQWDGVDAYRLSHGKISNIWAGDDWTAILNDTGTYKAPWIPRPSWQGSTASGVLVEQCGELLRREDSVALDHELTDLLPVRVVGEQYRDAIMAGSRSEERVADGQQRPAFLRVGPQHEQGNGLAGWVLPRHEQTERPPADVERMRR
jgi:hypothetical protein